MDNFMEKRDNFFVSRRQRSTKSIALNEAPLFIGSDVYSHSTSLDQRPPLSFPIVSKAKNFLAEIFSLHQKIDNV